MTDGTPVRREPRRIVLFGMECAFTAEFTEALKSTRAADIVAIVLPRTEAEPIGFIDTAPVIGLSERRALRSPQFRSALSELDGDFMIVACFPWRIPASVRAIPRYGSMNVHPSLLPDGRGPEPVFWAFRRNLHTTGVTVHLLDDGFDTGPVVAQRSFAIPPDATMISLECALAQLGAELVAEIVGTAFPIPTSPQTTEGEYQAPFPGTADLLVTTAWTGNAAARFIDAVVPVFGPVEVLVHSNGQRLAVTEVLSIEESNSSAPPVLLREDEAWIRFSDRTLRCRLRLVQHQLTLQI